MTVDARGRLYVNFGPNPDHPADEATVTSRTAALLRRDPQTPVLIRADTAVPYGTVAHAMVLLQRAGADKVTVNTAAIRRPALLTELAAEFGSQAVVLAIDARRDGKSWRAYVRGGHESTDRDAVAWAHEGVERGAGEILLTSMDRDGTREGFDCELTAAVSKTVSVPVIASGGADTPQDFLDVFEKGKADAALAASIFHDNLQGFGELKRFLAERGVPMRVSA